MSGILAVLNTDGRPVQKDLLRQTLNHLSFRGPDYGQMRVGEGMGMAHAGFQTTNRGFEERQPTSLDGRVWINAYARLDDRKRLIDRLRSEGRVIDGNAADTELMLHAYDLWKTDCPRFLMGDFAFIIWDAREERLFCARDQFGVRSFYYAVVGNTLIVGNSLSSIRAFPGVPQELDDLALADFLLFGHYHDLEMTAYAAIRRLPPACTLTWKEGELSIKRYWSLTIEAPLIYRQAGAYVEQFRELLGAAVNDRLDSEQVAISMSGGLDSTAIAALAVEKRGKNPAGGEIQAFTNSYASIMDDDEASYAKLAASYLHLPHHIRNVGTYTLFDRWDGLDLRTSEPVESTLAAWAYDEVKEISAFSRVTLTGLGGDPLFFPEPGYHYALIEQKRVREFFFMLKMCGQTRRFPPLYVRTRLRQRFGQVDRGSQQAILPRWLNGELIKRYGLVERWQQFQRGQIHRHPRRPFLFSGLRDAFWPFLLESYDADHQLTAHEARHPFFDLRLIRFMLRLPPVPWCVDKHLLRAAMRGILPEVVRRRPKQPLARYPQHTISSVTGKTAMERLSQSAGLVSDYGDLETVLAMLKGARQANLVEYQGGLRLIGLAKWLDGNQR